MDLSDTVLMCDPNESPPFHGFPSAEDGGHLEVNGGNNHDGRIKRNRSSPGTGSETSKRKLRHPVIGSKILVETAKEKGIYQVHSKKNSEEGDFQYCLVRDGKVYTLNLKRVYWEFIDGAEKVPLKSTV